MTLVLTRVLVRDEDELRHVLQKKSVGTPSDCWTLIDPSTYTDEMREKLLSMHKETEGWIRQDWDENVLYTTCIIDGELTFFRIWHIKGPDAPMLHAEKATLSEIPIDEM